MQYCGQTVAYLNTTNLRTRAINKHIVFQVGFQEQISPPPRIYVVVIKELVSNKTSFDLLLSV